MGTLIFEDQKVVKNIHVDNLWKQQIAGSI